MSAVWLPPQSSLQAALITASVALSLDGIASTSLHGKQLSTSTRMARMDEMRRRNVRRRYKIKRREIKSLPVRAGFLLFRQPITHRCSPGYSGSFSFWPRPSLPAERRRSASGRTAQSIRSLACRDSRCRCSSYRRGLGCIRSFPSRSKRQPTQPRLGFSYYQHPRRRWLRPAARLLQSR